MMTLSRWKIGLVLLALFGGLLFSVPNFLPSSVRDGMKPFFLPTQTLNLGLDLRGGVYLLLEVDTDAMTKAQVTQLVEDVRSSLSNANIPASNPGASGTSVTVHINNAADVERAYAELSKLPAPLPRNATEKDKTVTKGNDQTIVLTLTPAGIKSSAAGAVDASVETVRRRIDKSGAKEVAITRQGANRIVVEAPGESDPEQLKRVLGRTARLTFQMVDETVSREDIAAGRVPPGSELLPDKTSPTGVLMVRKRVMVEGNNLKKANVTQDQNQATAIGFAFDGAGAQKFGKATSENVGKRFAIILDGEVISAPVINGPILGGTGIIQGRFTPEEASELVNLLNSGALPAPLKVADQRGVGAELGADAVQKGFISTIIGFVTIVVFIFLAYGFVFGGAAIASLVINLLLILASMTLFQTTLTLPGIAGLVLSLAVAVDANVLIYERIRDEERTGHKPLQAMDVGFQRALVSILDANITSAISALIMLGIGAGPVKGFAIALLIGVVTSVVSAIFVSQVLLGWWYVAFKPKKLPI